MDHNYRDIYRQLVRKLEERSRLGGVMGVMHWDQEVIMPPGAASARAQQMAALAGVLHEKSTHPALGYLLTLLQRADSNDFSQIEWCNIREARREYDLGNKVPKELVQAMAELGSRGHQVWAKAREENRFEDFAPILERFIELKKRWAGHAFPNLAPYDANIDIFERGMTMEKITPIFDKLKAELVPLIRNIAASDHRPDASMLEGEFPLEKQRALGKSISSDMGFSFDHGRMDVSVHPFCGGGHPTDVRITTRYRSDSFIESLYAVIHETGHGLYEQGRMNDSMDLPVSEPLTMGVHESQSLFWERMIAQTKSFCVRYRDTFAEMFPETLEYVTAQSLYEAINRSQPSFIRVEADEATYPMHIILRYEVEKGLFDGTIKVSRLPEVWNDKMEEYLGIRPPTDTLGVLQDVHWSGGSFGYFPSYTLGAMYACQFYSKMKEDLSDVPGRIEAGDLGSIKNWLNENIHKLGRLYTPDKMLRMITGNPLDPDVFTEYLKMKYRAIYRLN
ncbi:carboxypeptidase [Candidatus Nitromaritima sp. SCGC AAA799-C22]|nr:carboxypeptidase [Candidatus Nitromaritima sp. SCGC AAA799-C22]